MTSSSLRLYQDGTSARAADPKDFDSKTAKDASPYFNVVADNGQVIGSSPMYSDACACGNGIRWVMENAPEAAVADNTSV